jgi:hypothetical protein
MVVSNNNNNNVVKNNINNNMNEDDADNNINSKKLTFTPNTMTTINLGEIGEVENGTTFVKKTENPNQQINGQTPTQLQVAKTPRVAKNSHQQHYPNEENSLELEKLKSLINQEEQLK